MTIEDVRMIILDDETRMLEMKKTTDELKDGMRSACAFLNTAGGWLSCVGHVQTRNHTSIQPHNPQVHPSARPMVACKARTPQPQRIIGLKS